jgi:hypothetical protein
VADQFVDPELETIYGIFCQRAAALEDGIADLEHSDTITTLDHIDFSVVFPLVTPRDGPAPNPHDNPFDFFSLSSLRNLPDYKNVAGFRFCYSPFMILELFDQIEHRREWFDSIRDSKSSDELRINILRRLSHVPTRPADVEKALENIISGHIAPAMANRVKEFKALVHENVVRNLFEFIEQDRFYAALQSEEDFADLAESIDEYRRRSSSNDPADRELHRIIDVYMVLATQKLARSDHKRLYYVGQERLRRIFPKPKEYTRDVLTPHMVLRTLKEVPSDRDLKTEALQNMRHRQEELEVLATKLLKFKGASRIPVALAVSLRNVNATIQEFVYGEARMTKPEEYHELIKRTTEKPSAVKDVFDAASKDAASAQDIVREVADSLRTEGFRELSHLKPNERVKKLFARLEGSG